MQPTFRLARQYQRGFTLIELMIAVMVAMFLMGGTLKIVQSTRGTFGTQNSLAQLQDNERLALTFMTEVIESAGYYPNPKINQPTGVFGAVGTFAAGQYMTGSGALAAAAPGDEVTVRFAVANGDGNVYGCNGSTNSAATATNTFTNRFYVNSAKNQLFCDFSTSAAPTAVPTPLVNGVKSLAISYGIQRNTAAATGSCTDTYVDGSVLTTTAAWASVCSVKITLTFINPLNPNGTASVSAFGKQYILVTRVIGVMLKAGVN